MAAILGLTFLYIAVQFLYGTGVQCYTPGSAMLDVLIRDGTAFINNYCNQSLSPSEYFILFILAHGLAIVAPHYLWKLFGGYFFFDLIKYLHHLRNTRTGRYEVQDFEIVKKIEREYQRKTIFYTYILKLGIQFLFALFSLIAGIVFFYNFPPSFICPENTRRTREVADDNGWPYNFTVTCIYPSLRFLSLIHYVDYISVGIVVVATLVGLAWCFLRHPVELGYRDIAKFVVDSYFFPENYVPKPFCDSPSQPRIKNDLDFLLLMLFRTDTGHGKVFKEIQIQREVDIRNKQNHELLQLFRTAQSEMGAMDRRTVNPHRIHDVHMLFKDRGFKGTPRNDVFRLFSPRFGITKHKPACNEPLDEEELKKVAEEMVIFGDRDKIVALLVQLGCHNAEGRHCNLNELHELLCTWLVSQKPTTGYDSGSGEHKESGITSVPPRKVLAGVLTGSKSDQLKLIGDRVYYGDLKKKLMEGLESDTSISKIDGSKELEAKFLDRLLGFIQFAPGNTFAMDISFGSTGCASILAWAFQEVTSVNFDHYLQEPGEETIEHFSTNITTLHFPLDIFVQRTENALKLGSAINRVFHGEGKVGIFNRQKNIHRVRTDFIVVGPIDHDSNNKTTVDLLINRLHQGSTIHDKAVLLAIRPLKIRNKVTLKQFVHYVPPSDLFEQICVAGDEEYQKMEHQIGRESIHIVTVKEDEGLIMTEEDFIRERSNFEEVLTSEITVRGISATCGDVECLFEFAVYRYMEDKTKKKAPFRVRTSLQHLKHHQDKSDSHYTVDAKDNDDGNESQVSELSDEVIQREKMTEEAEYWSMIAQGGPAIEFSDGLNLPITGRQSSTESFVSPNLESAVAEDSNGSDDNDGDDGIGNGDGDGDGEGDGTLTLHKEEMTEEEEYWFMRAQGGIRVDGWQPPSRTPTEDSSDNEHDNKTALEELQIPDTKKNE